MTVQPPGQRYSPDGRFWWDGTAWRPVEAAPPTGPAGQPGHGPFQPPSGVPGSSGAPGPSGFPASGSPGTAFPPPRGAVPGRPSKAGFLLALVGTLVAAAVLGGLIGGVTGMVTTEPPGNDSAPPFAAEFPTGERRYMTGVTLALVVEDWLKKANSWVCTDKPDAEPFSRATKALECTPPGDEGDMRVTVEYDADDKVRVVTSTCRLGLKTKACTTLAATLADTVLTPQGDQLRKQASEWATKNADSERVTTIGGIRLEASLSPHGMTASPGV
ncbi:hypothetical protein ABNF97_33410 [Plantactinospora sp. B6F1]|uniref:hypothetical protein n=1 Tax=Plantactinospora sp. B6F1 TaxID=3158971 RepID=UPI0032D995AB